MIGIACLSILLLGRGSADAASFDLQAAINACPAGGTVNVPAGTITLTDQVMLRSNITIKGAGVGQTVLYLPGDSSLMTILLTYSGVSNTTISDLTLRADAPQRHVFGIWVANYSSLQIERVRVENCRYGFKIDTRGSNLLMRDVSTRNCGQNYISNLTGGRFYNLDLEVVSGARLEGTSFHALYLCDNNHDLQFYNTRLRGGSGHSLQFWCESIATTDVLFDGLNVSHTHPIVMGGAQRVTFRSANVTGTGGDYFGCWQLTDVSGLTVDGFTASGMDALVATYQGGGPASNVTFRNGTYTGSKLVLTWEKPISNLVIENVQPR